MNLKNIFKNTTQIEREYWALKWIEKNNSKDKTFYTKKSDIQAWLEYYKINNYTLEVDAKYGFVVNTQNVKLHKLQLNVIPVKFGKIEKNFNVSQNNLDSLEWAPSIVGGDFFINHNNLTSLIGAPKEVGNLNASYNKLASLEGCPWKINNTITITQNKLKNLVGAPEKVNYLFCEYNQLESLEGLPKIIKLNFSAQNNNLTSLKGIEESSLHGSINLLYNPIKRIDYFPKQINNAELFLIQFRHPSTNEFHRIDKGEKAYKLYQDYLVEFEKEKIEEALKVVEAKMAQKQLFDKLQDKWVNKNGVDTKNQSIKNKI